MLSKNLRLVFAVLIAAVNTASAQDSGKLMHSSEDTLIGLADSMYNAFIPDDRTIYTEKFVKTLVNTLKNPNSFDYKFEKLQEKINILYPEDKSFRMFNWMVITSEVDTRYYGAIQMNSGKLKLFPLIDYSANLGRGAEDSVLSDGKWMGAMYYRIMKHEVDGQEVYTLFGKNAANVISDKKILEPMTMTAKGPVFGAPIFNVRSETSPNERIRRFIIEYKKGVQASMNWDSELQAIFFDKLVSEQNDPNRKYTFVPSGQYDGFKWNNDSWYYTKDLIPIDILEDGKAPVPTPIKGKE